MTYFDFTGKDDVMSNYGGSNFKGGNENRFGKLI
jgi:hypothetical protein